MGKTLPEEIIEKLGEPSAYYQWDNGPSKDWLVEYEGAELWFREADKRLWRLKVKHPSLKDTAEGTVFYNWAPTTRVGNSEIKLADIDLLPLVRFRTAIEATRHLEFKACGTKYETIKELCLRQENNGLVLTLSYMLDDVLLEDGERDFDYYLYGIYVDDQRA